MPPKPSNHAQFPVSDPDNEVVCPITQADGTGCRKRCLGEKRFRSMQEHIRRAHPEYYIPKLPATRESFELMVNTPPHEIPKPEAQDHWSPPSERRERHYIQRGPTDGSGLSYAPTHDSFDLQRSFDQGVRQNDGFYGQNIPTFDISRSPAHLRRGSLLPAAAALAQLHYARPDGDWSSDHVGMFQMEQDDGTKGPQNFFTDDSADVKQNHFADPTLSAEQQFLDSQFRTDHQHNNGNGNGNGNGHMVEPSSSFEQSPPNRSAAPAVQMQRSWSKGNRQRKSSVSQNARKAKHERRTSRDYLRPTSHDRKAFSAEPMNAAAVYGKRWEDLIDAATSATEEDSRDLTPIPASPFQSPRNAERTPMPAPFALGSQFQSYTASPLQQALTPPPADGPQLDLQPFPSVEEPSSVDSNASGTNFHIMASNQALSSASDSSPMFSTPVQIYCAGCRRLSILKESFACSECICGLCQGCVDALISEQTRGRAAQCPRCRTIGARFKLFQLDIR
ncbi:hypothetical protein KVT40_007622 [Elsinoe batatas]|uniref:RING zinc finger-like domain-containing protein n=1 Tax=Elsinoe batatas TaxID=2601811 RepID=A0A8K0PAF4_9PEZI|nr:hypothetical protein KVT40_007622 [Elsinoe batatas]